MRGTRYTMIRLVIFDLDGTLLDTVGDLAGACDELLAARGYPGHSTEEYRRFVGNGINKLIERALPAAAASPEAAAELRPEFVRIYRSRITRSTRPYEGVAELLESLRGMGLKLAVASNKFHGGTRQLVEHFFPGVEFCAVLGQREGVPMKPDPAVVREIMDVAGVGCDEVLYVGDSGVDMQTARNAGVLAAGVTWGFRPRGELEACGADYVVESAGAVALLAASLNGG